MLIKLNSKLSLICKNLNWQKSIFGIMEIRKKKKNKLEENYNMST